ncbi:Lrp/AsnC ligand binding domain-containing protein [Pseudobacteriovorax antillogorgiicola]|uniref:Lrp/AsnC ligand binding domain-containing protein n=1 Tax=Pseudobacteriovorax antillogorgiicola TaxID=1513793 RepID=UPI0013562E05|nr:Lrp/AsnC ligand binding domain-containing protein [Pseudobacteriovorax antillogorgiicola]
MSEQIDSLDRKILRLMQQDSRMPFLEIARELKVSGGTVHGRVKKMKEMGLLLGTRISIDPGAMGYRLSAFIGIQINEASRLKNVAQELSKLAEVLEIHYTTGNFGLLIKILVRETAELYEILSQKIQQIKGVQSTQTLIILNTILERDLQV